MKSGLSTAIAFSLALATGILFVLIFLSRTAESEAPRQALAAASAEAPTVTGVAPSSAPNDLNTSIAITGTGFAAAQPALSSLPASAAPNVDGTLSPGEWSNKVVVSMNGFNDPNRTRQADLYVMHDATNLYVAVVFPDSVQNAGDYLMVGLDDGHDHVATDGGEDAMGYNVGGKYEGFSPEYDDLRWGGVWWVRDASQHGAGGRTYDSTGSKYTYEFRKPLNSGDSQDAGILLGSLVGFRIEAWAGAINDWFRYPPDTVDADPTRWGQWADLSLPPGAVDLTASKRVQEIMSSPGQAITYTITLTNTGSLPAAGIRVTDTVPPSTTYRTGSLAATGGSVAYTSGVITWTGTVEAGQSEVITYGVTLSATLQNGSVITNVATIDNGLGSIFATAPVTTTVAGEVRKVYLPFVTKGYAVATPTPTATPSPAPPTPTATPTLTPTPLPSPTATPEIGNAWWTPSWSDNGKTLVVSYDTGGSGGGSEVTWIDYQRDGSGRLIGKVTSVTRDGSDRHGRRYHSNEVVRYGIVGDWPNLGIKRYQATTAITHTAGFSYTLSSDQQYTYDQAGTLTTITATNLFSGTLPGGFSYSGSAPTASSALRIEQASYYKNEQLYAQTDTIIAREFQTILGEARDRRRTERTTTSYADGARRESEIVTVYGWNEYGTPVSVAGTGTVTRTEILSGSPITYTGTITVTYIEPQYGVYKSRYEEKISADASLPERLPFEAIFSNDLRR